MKETREITVFVAKVIRQSLESFADGFQFSDIASFLDEAMDAPKAFTGLDQCKAELQSASLQDIHKLVDEVKEILSSEFDNEVVLEAIISAVKAMFFAIKLSVK
jgi:hypothetical protein